METYQLTIIRVSDDPEGNEIRRTHHVQADSIRDATRTSTVASLVSTMDNVVDWWAREVQ